MNKKVKVFFDANPLVGQKTGVGYLTENLITALATAHPEISFVGHYFNFAGRKDVNNLPQLENIHFVATKLFPTKLINVLRKLHVEVPLDLFFKQRADIYLFTNFVSSPFIKKTKQVLFVHDLSYIDYPEYVSAANAHFLKNYVSKSIKRASQIVTISEFSKSRILDVYSPKSPIHVMQVPAKAPGTTDASVMSRLNIPKNYILFVGTIEPRKNISTLLDAYALLDKKTDVALVLAGGKGWKDEEILQKISILSSRGRNIIQTGYISDLEKNTLYKNAAVYVQPSHYEGFGMPILEAMSHGVPVICSDIPVLKEVASDAALFFDPSSPEKLAELLQKITGSKSEMALLSSLSKKRFSQYPSWDEVAEILYKSIIESL